MLFRCEDYCLIPGRCGLDLLAKETPLTAAAVGEMVQNALFFAVDSFRTRGIEPTVAFIREGPYAIPTLRGPEATGQ